MDAIRDIAAALSIVSFIAFICVAAPELARIAG